MASTEAQKRASIKWQKENMHRIPLDVKNEYYKDVILPAVKSAKPKIVDGKKKPQTVGGFIKDAIAEKIERDSGGSIQLSAEDAERFTKEAEARDMTLQELVLEAVNVFLKDY